MLSGATASRGRSSIIRHTRPRRLIWRPSSLAISELLLQEARPFAIVPKLLDDTDGRREAEEEALIRMLIEHEVATPEPDEATCRRHYDQNRRQFCSPDIYDASHILFAAVKSDAKTYAQTRVDAVSVLALLHEQPQRLAEFARIHSACPSGAQGGNLGQITKGQTTPEFERALNRMMPDTMSEEPVATRYGFHIIRLDRLIEDRGLPFKMVAKHIASYLKESVKRRAIAQYIAHS